MKLVANECVQCRRPVGYVTADALQIPTLCVLCASDKETIKEWGHTIAKTEKPVRDVLLSYRRELIDRDLK